MRLLKVYLFSDPVQPTILSPNQETFRARQMKAEINIGQDAELIKGSVLVVKCPSVSNPISKTIWIINGNKVSSNNHPNVRVENESNELTITNVTEEFVGEHVCIVENIMGKDTESSQVSVKGTMCFICYVKNSEYGHFSPRAWGS